MEQKKKQKKEELGVPTQHSKFAYVLAFMALPDASFELQFHGNSLFYFTRRLLPN